MQTIYAIKIVTADVWRQLWFGLWLWTSVF